MQIDREAILQAKEKLGDRNAQIKKAVAPRPIIALPTSLSLKEISKQELLNIISKTLCKDKADHDDRGE